MSQSLKQLLQSSGLFAKKSMGQNFLLDDFWTDKVAAAAGDLKGKNIVEVGPGGLTRSLIKNGAENLVLIEKDERFVDFLNHYCFSHIKGDKPKIINDDALKFDFLCLTKPLTIISNLPYNISTALLQGWLEISEHIETMTLMFQKEVAMRILAGPEQNKDYGRLSVLTQLKFNVTHQLDLPPSAFDPAPKIWSSVLHFVPRKDAPEHDLKKLNILLETGFQQRRKMLRASLKSVLNNVEEVLVNAEIEPTQRPEEVPLEKWCKLSLVKA